MDKAFICYSRSDEEFALKLAKELRSFGTNIWIDQLDIQAGDRWDMTIERNIDESDSLIVILSPASVKSDNVLDEVNFALEEKKRIIAILFQECRIPYRLRRLQQIDFRENYEDGIEKLIKYLDSKDNESKSSTEDEDSISHSYDSYQDMEIINTISKKTIDGLVWEYHINYKSKKYVIYFKIAQQLFYTKNRLGFLKQYDSYNECIEAIRKRG